MNMDMMLLLVLFTLMMMIIINMHMNMNMDMLLLLVLFQVLGVYALIFMIILPVCVVRSRISSFKRKHTMVVQCDLSYIFFLKFQLKFCLQFFSFSCSKFFSYSFIFSKYFLVSVVFQFHFFFNFFSSTEFNCFESNTQVQYSYKIINTWHLLQKQIRNCNV